ncbi:MAG: hypothetical protein Kilf2KO_07030 [Rhodospirillales bacterium]
MTAAVERERAAVTAVVRAYLDGMVFADEALLRQALHPRWHCIGHIKGSLEWLSLDDFIATCKQARPSEPDPDYFWRIVSLEIVGDSALLHLEDDYLGRRFTDHLTLLKHEGRWQIVNKVFYLHPKS